MRPEPLKSHSIETGELLRVESTHLFCLFRIMTHAEKLQRIETLMASPDVIELENLAAEVDSFEREVYPIPPPTVAEAMKFRREQMQENQREISLRAGMSLNRWKHLESGKNEPSLPDARKLYAIGIPASVILGHNESSAGTAPEGDADHHSRP